MAVLLRLLRFLGPYRVPVAITAASAAGLMACSITLPYLAGRVIDDVVRGGDEDLLLPLVGAVLAVAVARSALGVVRRLLSGRVSLSVEYDLRGRLFGRLSGLDAGYFDRMPVGQLMSRTTSDLQAVRFFLGYGLIFAWMHLFTLVAVSGVLLWLDWQLALLSLAMGPGLAAVAWRYSRRSHPVLVDVQQRVGQVTQMAEESTVGIRVVKAFGREPERTARFGDVARSAFDRSMDAARLRAFYQPLMAFLPLAGLAAVLAYGGTLAIEGRITVGEFVTFYLLLTMLTLPFRSLGMLVGSAQRAIASGTRIFEVLDARPEVVERPGARSLPAGGGELRFAGVSFAYGDGPPVLSDVDLTVPAGRTVALVGPTGSGKTTLSQLIPRVADPTAGKVILDGVDVRDLRLAELRRAVGVVSQEPFLFSASVHDNIAYGRPGATRAEVEAAARLAQAGFIADLPEGYDTVVGERGFTLSGGERQRVAIARAALIDPRVLILDEATASVDASTEREIQRALRAVMEGRTTVVIAHRASTVALADELVVLESGRVADRGTHEELIARSDLYREIHEGGLVRPQLVGSAE